MKRILILLVSVILIPVFSAAQTLENLDYISPFNDNIAAVKQGNQWAFVNNDGTLLVDFRDDLVLTKTEQGDYPIFKSNRCKIKHVIDGIAYFGFIDTSGKVIIEPTFLNATNFKGDQATVLLLDKDTVGKNKMLKKPVVSYDYFEVAINTKGEVLHYIIEAPTHITLSKEYLKNPPMIRSRMLSTHTFAIKGNDKKWSIIKINN